MKKLICIAMLVLLPTAALAATINLSWNAPATNCDGTTLIDLAGFTIFYGESPRPAGSPPVCGDGGPNGEYPMTEDIAPDTTAFSLDVGSSDVGRNFYITVTAWNVAGEESDYSGEVSFYVPPTIHTPMNPTGLGGVVVP